MELPEDTTGLKQQLGALRYQYKRYGSAEISDYNNRVINGNLHQSETFKNSLEFNNPRYDIVLVCDGAKLGYKHDEFSIDQRVIDIL